MTCVHIAAEVKKPSNPSRHHSPDAAVNLESNQWLGIKNDNFLNVHLQRCLLE